MPTYQYLQNAIEELLRGYSHKDIARAREKLSAMYRQEGARQVAFHDDLMRKAYIASRMPATYAVLHHLFSEMRSLVDTSKPLTVLDVGAGPGTALWAAADTFAWEKATLLEMDRSMVDIGRAMQCHAQLPLFERCEWQVADITTIHLPMEYDVVVCSYSLGELGEGRAIKTMLEVWQRAKQALLLVEPGTPAGFRLMRSFRSALIANGATIRAPCTHQGACPMVEGDWCHFSKRLERSFTHRMAKGASLPFEDEKYSYLIACRSSSLATEARILSQPKIHTGHVELKLCSAEGLTRKVVSKRDRDQYRLARKASWGDLWP